MDSTDLHRSLRQTRIWRNMSRGRIARRIQRHYKDIRDMWQIVDGGEKYRGKGYNHALSNPTERSCLGSRVNPGVVQHGTEKQRGCFGREAEKKVAVERRPTTTPAGMRSVKARTQLRTQGYTSTQRKS